MAYQKVNYLKRLQEEFEMLTKNFDLDDWRDVRTEYYWESDKLQTEYERLTWKLDLIRYYVQHGIPKQ